MQKLFDVLIRCTDKRLPTILQACDGALELQWVKAAEVEVPRKSPHRVPHKQMAYVNGKRDKGISGAELAVELLTKAGGAVTYDKLAAGFAARGFAGNSVSPVLSQLRQIGVVDMPHRGTWKLTKKATAA